MRLINPRISPSRTEEDWPDRTSSVGLARLEPKFMLWRLSSGPLPPFCDRGQTRRIFLFFFSVLSFLFCIKKNGLFGMTWLDPYPGNVRIEDRGEV
jgi:hypothetical protein